MASFATPALLYRRMTGNQRFRGTAGGGRLAVRCEPMGRVDGISLHHGDRCARFTNGCMVYLDDIGDYSTNAPIMDRHGEHYVSDVDAGVAVEEIVIAG